MGYVARKSKDVLLPLSGAVLAATTASRQNPRSSSRIWSRISKLEPVSGRCKNGSDAVLLEFGKVMLLCTTQA